MEGFNILLITISSIIWIMFSITDIGRKITAIFGGITLLGIISKYVFFIPVLFNTGDAILGGNLIASLVIDIVNWLLPP
ncbi:hypothetical protein, partial [Methanocaldococcus sp.]